jgi:polyisoprenoid-binding protein YceI
MIAFAALLLWSASARAVPVALDPDPKASSVLAVTRRSGILGFLGHEHAIRAGRWSAALCMDRGDPSLSRVGFTVDTASLTIDEPETRKEAGLETGGPGPADIAKIQRKMLGPEVLDTARFPEMRFRSKTVRKQPGNHLSVTGDLTLHGVTREITVPVIYDLGGQDKGAFSVDFRIRQTDFGIEPQSGGGVVNVKDEMEIRLRITAAFASKPCEPPLSAQPVLEPPGRSQATQR